MKGSRQLIAALLACGLVAGCGAGEWVQPAGAVAVANAASVVVLHRGLLDAVWSTVSGRDCSIVYLDRGGNYCREEQPPPEPQPYCTRSLGVADCWSNPEALMPMPPGVADGPMALTPAQEANRTRSWTRLR